MNVTELKVSPSDKYESKNNPQENTSVCNVKQDPKHVRVQLNKRIEVYSGRMRNYIDEGIQAFKVRTNAEILEQIDKQKQH
jgi:hypothetical protein